MMEPQLPCLARASPGPTVDPPKDLLQREFGTHDRGPKRCSFRHARLVAIAPRLAFNAFQN